MQEKNLKQQVLKQASTAIDEAILLSDAITGDTDYLYYRLKYSIKRAQSIDIIVSFLMESGVKLLMNDLKEAVDRGCSIRILTGNYLNITQPQALYLLRNTFGDTIDVRFYNVPNKSFHPKAYIFHYGINSEIYIGSSNISRGALTTSVEWNYRFDKVSNEKEFGCFVNKFEDLFNLQATVITDEVLRAYSKQWHKPKVLAQIEESELETGVRQLITPQGAQIEALYALKQTREEAFMRGLVVAATGIGKTYLAAFDSMEFERILFIAHREEILKQAAASFEKVRQSKSIGYFYNKQKDIQEEMIFALVQTLGKDEYLTPEYFKPEAFEYIVIDEFHHAQAKQYQKLIDYFKPKFLLGLTATPERLDNKDVGVLCYSNIVYDVRIQEAINKGWLVPFRYYGVYDETIDYAQIVYKNGHYDAKELDEKLMVNKRAEFILKHYLKYDSKVAMGFCATKYHAEYMAKYFNDKGIPSAAVYSGEQGEMTSEREQAIKKLVQQEIQVIFSVDMFNEGIDIPSIDTVMFLRPTESPTIFLQQLGRGLRKYKHKNHLIVLDFIGNYKKAGLIPFLLSGKEYDQKQAKGTNPNTIELPEECIVDFDFRLIDLFKQMATKGAKKVELIDEAYDRIKNELGEVPSRVAFFTGMDEQIYAYTKQVTQANYKVFNNYLAYLYPKKELTGEEEMLFESIGGEFITMVETTSMSRMYKMPLLLAFYNRGNIKCKVTEEDIYESFKKFYTNGANAKDLLRDKQNKDFKVWSKEKWVKLAIDNPVTAFLKTHSNFFKQEEGYVLVLNKTLKEVIQTESFKKHFKDAIALRTVVFYNQRLERQ